MQFPVRSGLIEANCEMVTARLADAAGHGAQLVVLPALWTTAGHHLRPRLESERSAAAVAEVRRVARRHGLVVVGSVLAAEAGRFFDQAHVIDGDGSTTGTYRRVHRVAEDAGLMSAGDEIRAISTSLGSLGVLIGDDVYFPEQAVALEQQRARLFAVPGAWTAEEADVVCKLLVARAIETHAFVVAANGATERPGAGARGGSMLIAPSGQVVARGGSGDELVLASLDLEQGSTSRRTRPLTRRRVPAAYAEALQEVEVTDGTNEAGLPTMGRVLTRAEMARESERLHARGRTLVFTNGCFDILHLGHVRYLEGARRLGDALCIGLNTDASVRRLGKAPERPIQPEGDRAAILASLRCVDYVVLFDEATPLELIRAVQPDVLVKGGDWKAEDVVGADVVSARGGRVVIADFVAGHSTTGVVERIRAAAIAGQKVELRRASPAPAARGRRDRRGRTA